MINNKSDNNNNEQMTTTPPPLTPLQQFLAANPFPLTYFDFVPALEEGQKKRIVGYYYENEYTPKLVQQVLETSGFKKSDSPKDSEIVVGSKPKPEFFDNLKQTQRVAHYNKAFVIGTKTGFHRHIQLYQSKQDTTFPCYLPTYILPDQINEFKENVGSAVWIQKPVGRSHARGIKLIKGVPELAPGSRVVVQKYAQYPLLLDNCKFDIRVYALVVSLDPLLIYIYNDGLVRIAEAQWNDSNLDPKIHITTGENCKVENFSRLWTTLEASKIDPATIRTRMEDIIIGVICTARDELLNQKNHKSCFELYGFDFLLTLDGNIYCLEANVTPSMSFKNPEEEALKKQLLVDTFNLSSLPKDTPELEKLMNTIKDADNKDFTDFMTILFFDQYQNRNGNFRCIFPTTTKNASSTKYLDQPTQADLALATWVSTPEEKKGDKLKVYVKAYSKVCAV